MNIKSLKENNLPVVLNKILNNDFICTIMILMMVNTLHLTSSSIPKVEMCVQIFYHFFMCKH